MPDTPELQAAFGQPGGQKPGCGFPVMHLLALFHAGTGFLLNLVAAPLRTHDHLACRPGPSRSGRRRSPGRRPRVLLVCPSGVARGSTRCSASFACIKSKSSIFGRIGELRSVPRSVGERGLPTSRWLQRLGRHDQLVEYRKPKDRPTWLTAEAYAALPDTLQVRELRYKIAVPGRRTRVVTIATTLLDPHRYPAADIAELYGQRWQIETNFRHLKQTLRMDVLRCKTVEGVRKELAMYALVYNLVRQVMLAAATRQAVPVERISFIDAVRWLADAVHGPTELKLRLVPERPGRIEPELSNEGPRNTIDSTNTPRTSQTPKQKKVAA